MLCKHQILKSNLKCLLVAHRTYSLYMYIKSAPTMIKLSEVQFAPHCSLNDLQTQLCSSTLELFATRYCKGIYGNVKNTISRVDVEAAWSLFSLLPTRKKYRTWRHCYVCLVFCICETSYVFGDILDWHIIYKHCWTYFDVKVSHTFTCVFFLWKCVHLRVTQTDAHWGRCVSRYF